MSRTGEIGQEAGRLVAEAFPDGTAPGAAVLVVDDGRVLYRGAAGLANLEHRVPLAPGMPFRLASLTKPLTATAVLMLAESGELALDDPLDRLLPGYPAGEPFVTPEHLLTHTSGIPEFTELPEWWAIHRQDVCLDRVIDLFKSLPPAFPPGSRWAYCNSGYLLLGAIIEAVSGQGYGDFLADRIFAPLGMSSTSYDATLSRVVPGMVSGYAREGDVYVHPEYFSNTHFHAAGGLTSTQDDLARWFGALSSGRLLGADTLRRMWTPRRLADDRSARYGHGWWVGECRGRPAVEHFGSLPGFANYLLALPDDGILVVVLSNDDAKLNRVERLAVELAAAALGLPYRPPAALALPAPELDRFAGTYSSDDGPELTLAVEAGRLTLRAASGERFALEPHAPLEFFFPEIPEARLAFGESGGRVTGLEWRPRRGMPVEARRTG